MDNDEQTKTGADLKVVSAVGRIPQRPAPAWVQALPGVPLEDGVLEVSKILSCVHELTRRAIERPRESDALMRASHYLSGMGWAMLEGQLVSIRGETPGPEKPYA